MIPDGAALSSYARDPFGFARIDTEHIAIFRVPTPYFVRNSEEIHTLKIVCRRFIDSFIHFVRLSSARQRTVQKEGRKEGLYWTPLMK